MFLHEHNVFIQVLAWPLRCVHDVMCVCVVFTNCQMHSVVYCLHAYVVFSHIVGECIV